MPALNELFDLSGRVAIVTGGSRGLGREMAEGLGEAGAALVLCARREEWLTPTAAALRARGFTVEAAVCDVSRPDQVQSVVDRAISTYGKLDILINNAGVSWGAEAEDMPFDKWQKVIAIKTSNPIPRVGAEGELKGVAVFLASDASNYITGQVIVVDGDRSVT